MGSCPAGSSTSSVIILDGNLAASHALVLWRLITLMNLADCVAVSRLVFLRYTEKCSISFVWRAACRHSVCVSALLSLVRFGGLRNSCRPLCLGSEDCVRVSGCLTLPDPRQLAMLFAALLSVATCIDMSSKSCCVQISGAEPWHIPLNSPSPELSATVCWTADQPSRTFPHTNLNPPSQLFLPSSLPAQSASTST